MFVREIFCLPQEYLFQAQLADKSYKIPRGAIRNKLSEVGLIGKLSLCKSMSEGDISTEVSMLFKNQFESEGSNGIGFQFYFLNTPAGTKLLREPNVNASFKWDGAAVLSLSRSILYIATPGKLKKHLLLKFESSEIEPLIPTKDVVEVVIEGEAKENVGDDVAEESMPSILYE